MHRGSADVFEQDPEFLLGIPLVTGSGLSRGPAASAPATGFGEVPSAQAAGGLCGEPGGFSPGELGAAPGASGKSPQRLCLLDRLQ